MRLQNYKSNGSHKIKGTQGMTYGVMVDAGMPVDGSNVRGIGSISNFMPKDGSILGGLLPWGL